MHSLHRLTSLLLVALALVVTGCGTTRHPSTREIRVLTYNIHHGEGTDGKLDLERIAAVIRAADPDLVALQEVDNQTDRTGRIDQAAELARLTGLHFVFGGAMPYANGEYGQAILSRWAVESSSTHPLPGEAGREPRIALQAGIRPVPGGAPITFIGTHFDHQRNDLRTKSADYLLDLAEKEKHPLIVAGDFNATPSSEPMQRLFTRFKDAAASHPEPTIPSDQPRNRIDYILVRPPEAWRVLETRVLDEPVASDHRPVLSRIELKR